MYDDAQDALAAEYVLGTLAADEREHAEALLEIDPGFADSVRVWERRLGELNVMVEAVEPPTEVWDKIRADLGDVAAPSDIPWADAGPAPPPLPSGAATPPPLPTLPAAPSLASVPSLGESAAEPAEADQHAPATPDELREEPIAAATATDMLDDEVTESAAASLAKSLAEPSALPPPRQGEADYRGADVVTLRRRVRSWRTVAIAAEAIAALLAIYIAAAQFYPALIPLRDRSAAPQTAQAPAAPELNARLVAVLQHEPTSPAFLLLVDPRSRTMVVRRVSATVDSGRSYELWLISKQFPAPRSLGLVGKDEFTERQIPETYDVAMLRTASYAVSLEPTGGSPTGVPTGPILFTGKIVEAVPASPPPAAQPRT